MNSNILLLGADGSGSESLKNLVLPGVGKFTIVDSRTVTGKDLSDNFFVSIRDFNLPLAEVLILDSFSFF